jgi:oligopeptide/dipeptide ABC transporter ATP-binding protein
MVFQDPYASLNPRKSLGQTLGRPFDLHRSMSRSERRTAVATLLEDVGLLPAESFIDRYPHQLSGGQRQRVVIARAIALQILNLLKRLRRKYKLTLLFISHDLAVVRSLCERVAVMYLGRVVEIGPTDALFDNPMHPYTKALVAATPVPDPLLMRGRAPVPLDGEIPSAMARPSGCAFHPRCPRRGPGCDSVVPDLRHLGTQEVACHYAEG